MNDYQDALFALEWATRGLESGGLDLLLEIESFDPVMCEAVLEVLAVYLIALAPWAPARPPTPSLSAAELRKRRALIRKAEAFAHGLDQHEGLGRPLAEWTRRYAEAVRASLEGRAVASKIVERVVPSRSWELRKSNPAPKGAISPEPSTTYEGSATSTCADVRRR